MLLHRDPLDRAARRALRDGDIYLDVLHEVRPGWMRPELDIGVEGILVWRGSLYRKSRWRDARALLDAVVKGKRARWRTI